MAAAIFRMHHRKSIEARSSLFFRSAVESRTCADYMPFLLGVKGFRKQQVTFKAVEKSGVVKYALSS